MKTAIIGVIGDRKCFHLKELQSRLELLIVEEAFYLGSNVWVV